MNSDIIPNGLTETVTDGSITKPALLVYAETDVTIANLVYMNAVVPPNTGAVDAFILKAGRWLGRVKSMTFSGTATIIYQAVAK